MFSKFFVDRPVFATVLSLVVVILGTVSLIRLPIAQYPEVAPPTIQVTAAYPGANAIEVARTVATPLEQEINGVERMLYMSSRCGNDGIMSIDITFELGTDLDTAQVLVQNRVAIAEAKLPVEVTRQGITTKKRSPNILLVVNMVSSVKPDHQDYRNNLYLSNYATLSVKDALARIAGVGDVSLFGAREYSMRVWLDPERLAARNLNVSDISRALQEQNVQVAAGRIGQPPTTTGTDLQLSISTQGRLVTPEEFGQVIIKTGDKGQVVRLREVAKIELGAKSYDVGCLLDGRESVGLAIFQRPGSNALETAEQVRAVMRNLKRDFPPGVDFEIVYDTTVFVEESITGVYHTLIEAFILVFIVVLVFLQDWRATILPMIDVPVSLIGTFGLMALFGFSLNNLTLFGLVLAIGIVVDDAIVVVENVERWLAHGMNARDATLKAMSEVTGPVIAITLVLFAVFIPTAFIAGINGQFYRQFALTIAASTGISAMNALTMTPSRTVQIFKNRKPGHGHHGEALPWWGIGALIGFLALFLFGDQLAGLVGITLPGHGAHGEPSPWYAVWGFRAGVMAIGLAIGFAINKPVNMGLGWFFRGFNWTFDKITSLYGMIVAGILRLSFIMILLYGGMMFLTYIGFQRIPTGFIPTQDKGYLIVVATLPDGSSLERTEAVMAEMAKLAAKDDGVAHTISVPGLALFTGTNMANSGTMFLSLKPFSERAGNPQLSAPAILGRLGATYSQVQDAFVLALPAPAVDGVGNAGGFKMQIEDRRGLGFDALQDVVNNMADKASRIPGLVGLFSTYRATEPQLYLEIDRTKARAAGVTFPDLFATLQGYLGSTYVNDYTEFNRNWQVTIQADQRFRDRRDAIGKLKVRNIAGKMVPLDSLLEVRDKTGPSIVSHYQVYNSADLLGSTLPGMSSGQALRAMEKLADEELPEGMAFEWTELSLQQVLAENDLLSKLVFPLAVLFVYMVLAAQYESWILPLAVILIVPMCVLAAVAGLYIMKMDNNIFTQIGLVVLIALASKNAILIVEFAKQLHESGESLREATVNACRLRLRPILMTSLAFILGVVPLVRAEGAGSEMRIALGVAVFSGMLGVTIFGIFFTPVFYYLLSWFGVAHAPRPPEDVALIPAVEEQPPATKH
jgi:multidrug efflux pump